MADSWEALKQECMACRGCALAETRTHVVFGDGAENAKLLFNDDGTPTARTEKILAATPMGRFGDSQKDLVGSILFLLNNDAAGFITGITLPIDGGFSAYSGV